MANYDGIMSFWKDKVKNKIYEIVDAQARADLQGKADASSLAAVATSGDYDDLLNKPTIPAAQVNADWNASSGVAEILNKPSFLGNYFRGYSTLEEPTEGDLNYYITDLENGNNLPDLKDGFVLSLKHKNIGQPVFVHHSRATTVVHYKTATIPAYGYNGNILGSDNPSHEILLVYSKYNEQGVEDGTGRFIAFLIGDTEDMKTVAFTGRYADLTGTPTIPTALSDLSDDSTHRVVTDTEKSTWSGKQDALTAGTNISISNNTISATDTKPSGYDTTGDKTDTVASSASWSILSSVSITRGMWIINYGANFPSLGSGNTGHVGVGVSDSSTATTAPPVNMRLTSQRITQDNYTSLSSSCIYECTSDTKTLYLKTRQTSGQSLSVEGKLRVIKIL